MKRLYLILIVIVGLLTSCETDFDVNAEWEETTVVYALLDASKDTQYIKINKAFLGEGDALMMAQYSDSINFLPIDLDVRLHKIGINDTLVSIALDTILTDKHDGLFPIDNNIIYRAITTNGFLVSDKSYAITIRNLISGNKVSSKTEVISNFSFLNFNSAYKFGFYNSSLPDSTKFRSKTIEWNKAFNGVIYQLDIRFNFLENGEPIHLIWSQPLVSFTGTQMNTKLEGAEFFNYLRDNILDDNTAIREFVNLDLVMTVGTQNLDTYIKVNTPFYGIVQERPQFTNINNGIGIFSSRFTHTELDIGLTDDTKSYLVNELGRNFQ